MNYISKEEFAFFEEKAKEDSSIQTFQIDEEAFLYLNFNEMPQPSLRELEKMVREIQVSEINEEEEEEKTEQEVVQVPEIPETPTGVDQKDLDDAFNELTKKKD